MRSKSGPIHIHAAEQTQEVDDCIAALGARPVEWLIANAEVDARWCLVHATHMTERETQRSPASGAVAGLCPLTEANLGDGIFNAEQYVTARGRFGIGSDFKHRARRRRGAAPARIQSAPAPARPQRAGMARRRIRRPPPLRRTRSPAALRRSGAPSERSNRGSARTSSCSMPTTPILPEQLLTFGSTNISLLLAGGWFELFLSAALKVVDAGVHKSRDAIADRYRRAMARLAQMS